MKLINGLIERLAFASTIITVAFVSMFIAVVWPAGAVWFMNGAVRGMMKLNGEGENEESIYVIISDEEAVTSRIESFQQRIIDGEFSTSPSADGCARTDNDTGPEMKPETE